MGNEPTVTTHRFVYIGQLFKSRDVLAIFCIYFFITQLEITPMVHDVMTKTPIKVY